MTISTLAIMAGAMVVMMIVQVAVLIVVAQAGRRAMAAAAQMQRDLQPILEKAHRISDDTARVTALALRQMERIDTMIATTALRVDEALDVVQASVVEPLRQGTAVMAGVRAAVGVVRAWLERDAPAREDTGDGGLFIG